MSASTSLIRTMPAPGGGAAVVVNEKVALDVRPSGGSFVSVSEIWLAVIETAQGEL